MAQIGLVSDTHGYLDPLVLKHFAACDEIWHLGDIGSMEVADALETCRPVRAVYGNIDDAQMRVRYPETHRFELEGVDCLLIHIAGEPASYTSQVRALLETNWPAALLCGHTHVVRAKRDARYGGMLYINPGAAGHEGGHLMRTAVLMELKAGAIARLQVLELGPRGRRSERPS